MRPASGPTSHTSAAEYQPSAGVTTTPKPTGVGTSLLGSFGDATAARMNTMISHANIAATTITDPRNDDGLALPRGFGSAPPATSMGDSPAPSTSPLSRGRHARTSAAHSTRGTPNPEIQVARPKPGHRPSPYLGGGKGIRTPDLNAASVALSQLSYTPTGGLGLYTVGRVGATGSSPARAPGRRRRTPPAWPGCRRDWCPSSTTWSGAVCR